MADYNSLKVPDLKKLLGERGLVISGNKADLIARLQEDDSKKSGNAPATSTGAGEDEIDWDEDDNKPAAEATSAPAAAAAAAGGVGRVDNPVAVPNQIPAIDPSKTNDLTAKQPESTPTTSANTDAVPAATTTEEAKPEEPKKDYTAGVALSDAQKELEKRAARAKRFAKPEAPQVDKIDEKKDEDLTPEEKEKKKLSERAKKFGIEKKQEEDVVKSIVDTLNGGLPERQRKRGREDREGGAGGRQAKRQTPDRRTEQPRGGRGGGGGGGRGGREGGNRVGGGGAPLKKITDDPTEAAKAEARAKRFAAAK